MVLKQLPKCNHKWAFKGLEGASDTQPGCMTFECLCGAFMGLEKAYFEQRYGAHDFQIGEIWEQTA